MKNKHSTEKKLALIALTGLMLISASAAKENFTTEFTALEGTVNSTGGLETTTNNLQGYDAAVYEFETSNFKDPKQFIGNYSTTDSKVNITLNVSSSDRHYAIYFYKNGYITYEAINSVDDSINCDSYCGKNIYFTEKTGATSNITLEQFDELAAGDPVHIGVNITAESPIDQTDYTGYIPDSSIGGPNLTEFYQTEVGYSLNVYNKTAGQNDRLENKEEIGTVTIDFGDYERLEYTTIDETGVYNITGETDPTVDSKISSGTNDTDSVEVQYLSEIKTIISSATNEYTRGPAEAEINLKDNLPANEADIAEEIEYVWLNSLEVGDSLISEVKGAQGLDAVDINDRNNYTVIDSDYLPYKQAKNSNGDWYLCHRAWVNDSRSFITKGKTSCTHFMIDDEEPNFSNFNGPEGQMTYSETGYTFGINISDNIQLERASLFFGLEERKRFTTFQNPAGENSLEFTTGLSTGSYTYEWRAWDKVMSEIGLTGAKYTTDLTVNPLAPNLGLSMEDPATGNIVNEVYWDDTVELNATTDTEFAPLGFSSNFTNWNKPSDGNKKGSYSTEISIDETGTFGFEARAGHENDNYTEETVSSTVKVKEIPTDADITLLDENDNAINSAGLMETVTVRLDPQASQKNSKAPVTATSNLTLSAWNNINDNGVYETDIQMKEEGTFEFNMTAGKTGDNNEGFTNSNDSETLKVSTTNGGDETLEWNKTVQNQETHRSEAFSYGLEVNYTGTASDLTWNLLNDNFTVSTGNSKENATVENSTALDVRKYEVPVEVYDSSGSYLTDVFNVTVNPDLYWNPEPNDQVIDEGNRYSQDLSGSVEYFGSKSNLKWNITENKDLFTVDQGLIEDKQELSTGSYTIGLNVTDDEGRKINTSYILTVDDVNSGGGGGGSTTVSSFSYSSPTKSLDISLSPTKVAEGVEVAVYGTLENAEGEENITITVDGEERAQSQVNSEGEYQTTFTAGSKGNKTVKASTESLEASTTLEVVEPVNFNSTTHPEFVETGERFTVCGHTREEAEINLYEDGNEIGSRTGTRICFNRTIEQSGTYDYRLTSSAYGKTVETSFTVDIAEPSSSTNEDWFTGTEGSASPETEDNEGSFGTGGITGAFTRAASGNTGKVGIAVLGGILITLLILLGL